MSANLFDQYGNQNSRRRYPFIDSATLMDADGQSLPVDFLIDACIYPIGLQGFVYMSGLDQNAGLIYLADSQTKKPCGTAAYTPASTAADVFETGPYARQIGTLVFGAGISRLTEVPAVRSFEPIATGFTPTTYMALNQVGVRGILLPDGHLLTGAITIEGRDGVVVSTFTHDGRPTLRFDVVGAPSPDVETCSELGPPICQIVVSRLAGSRFNISQYDPYVLALTANGLTLDGICDAAKARKRKDNSDPCVAVDPPADPLPGDPVTLNFVLCGNSTSFSIVAPSAVDYQNPIEVTAVDSVPGPANRLTIPPGTEADAIQLKVDKFRLPPSIAGGVKIAVQGIGKGQLP